MYLKIPSGTLLAILLLTGCSKEPSICTNPKALKVAKALLEGAELSPDALDKAAQFLVFDNVTEVGQSNGETSCSAKYTLSKEAAAKLATSKGHSPSDKNTFLKPKDVFYKVRRDDDGEYVVGLTNFNLQDAEHLQKTHASVLNPPSRGDQEAEPPSFREDEANKMPSTPPELGAPEALYQSTESPGNRGNFDTPQAMAVTEFYRKLEIADGEAASSYVIPEKRQAGPLSAPAITSFYSGLQEPLQLDDVRAISGGQVAVRYTYKSKHGRMCAGRALVTLAEQNGEHLIKSITARDRCS